MLHVVNGDEISRSIRASGILSALDPALKDQRDPDDVVAWRDVLYEGPVRAALSPVNLAHERSQFIASQGWEPYISVRQDFGRRDSLLASTNRQDEVVFWFESDLYDLLQLVQALDRLAVRRPEGTRFSWVLVDRLPENPSRHGFGSLAPDRVVSLLATRQPVPGPAWAEARAVWTAFTADDPGALLTLDGATTAIPWLSDGLRRLLEEYPAVGSGLSRSEHLVLEAMEPGPIEPQAIFDRVHASESRPFLGDTQVWDRLDRFATAPVPLIERADGQPWTTARVDLMSVDEPDMEAFHAQRLQLTASGRSVLRGELDWLTIRGTERWIGGYRIPAAGSWRFDTATGSLVAPPAGA